MTHVATIRKNAREELRVTLENFKGHDILSLRVWFDAGEGEMRPGKQGLALRVELMPDLMEALRAAEEVPA